jgi:DNA-binding GntR family transcriptional regulator
VQILEARAVLAGRSSCNGRAERSFAEHTAIVGAVAAGDAVAAEAAMRHHLSGTMDALRESVAYIREP